MIIPNLHKQLDISNQQFMFGKRLLRMVPIITDSQGSKRNTGRCKIQNNQKLPMEWVGGKLEIQIN